jgi:hypothetical protein
MKTRTLPTVVAALTAVLTISNVSLANASTIPPRVPTSSVKTANTPKPVAPTLSTPQGVISDILAKVKNVATDTNAYASIAADAGLLDGFNTNAPVAVPPHLSQLGGVAGQAAGLYSKLNADIAAYNSLPPIPPNNAKKNGLRVKITQDQSAITELRGKALQYAYDAIAAANRDYNGYRFTAQAMLEALAYESGTPIQPKYGVNGTLDQTQSDALIRAASALLQQFNSIFPVYLPAPGIGAQNFPVLDYSPVISVASKAIEFSKSNDYHNAPTQSSGVLKPKSQAAPVKVDVLL